MEQTSRKALGVELRHTISCSFLFDFLSWTHGRSSWIVIILPSLTIYLLSIPHFTPLLAFLFFRAKVTPHRQSESRDVGLQRARTHDTPAVLVTLMAIQVRARYRTSFIVFLPSISRATIKEKIPFTPTGCNSARRSPSPSPQPRLLPAERGEDRGRSRWSKLQANGPSQTDSRIKYTRVLKRSCHDVAMDVDDALCLGRLIRQRNGFLPDDQLYRMRSQDVREQR